jgi:hypothetical protein
MIENVTMVFLGYCGQQGRFHHDSSHARKGLGNILPLGINRRIAGGTAMLIVKVVKAPLSG